MKYALMATLMAATALSGVYAADAPKNAPMPAKPGMMTQGKGPMKDGPMAGMRDEMRKDFQALGEKERTALKAAHEACKADLQKAQTADAQTAAMQPCRAKAKEVRKQFFDQREALIEKREAQMDKMRADMMAKRAAAMQNAQPASGEPAAK